MCFLSGITVIEHILFFAPGLFTCVYFRLQGNLTSLRSWRSWLKDLFKELPDSATQADYSVQYAWIRNSERPSNSRLLLLVWIFSDRFQTCHCRTATGKHRRHEVAREGLFWMQISSKHRIWQCFYRPLLRDVWRTVRFSFTSLWICAFGFCFRVGCMLDLHLLHAV